jgi:hypothetical protein
MVLARAMAKAPGDRHGTCSDLIRELQAALAGMPIRSFEPSSVSTGRRFERTGPPSDLSTRGAPPRMPPPPARVPRASTTPVRSTPPQTLHRPPARSTPPSGEGDRSYVRAAAIVAVAILLTAGGIAAALLLRSRDAGPSTAVQQAQRLLLERTTRLDQELVNLKAKLQRDHGAADANTRKRLAADHRQAIQLVAQARRQQSKATAASRSLLMANEQLLTAVTGLKTYLATRSPVTLRVVGTNINTAGRHVDDASGAIQADAPSGTPTPPVSAGGVTRRSVQLPGGALASVSPPSGWSIDSFSDVGDMNDDGQHDFGFLTSSGDATQPRGFVVFGGKGDGDVHLGSLRGRGFEVAGATGLAPAGDVNNDHREDLAVMGPTDLSGLA